MITLLQCQNIGKKLNSYGCQNVRVIHNSYDVNTYNIKQSEAMEVLKKYKIPTDKPIIYIGNALKEKGAIQVYITHLRIKIIH